MSCMYVYHVHAWCLGPSEAEEGIRPLELELQMAVSHHVGAGNE